MRKYISYMLTTVIALGTLTPVTYADTQYPDNIIYDIGQENSGQIVFYDALNNLSETIVLDTLAPTVPNNTAYYKDQIAIVKATETGEAGLWKVVSEPSKTAQPLSGGEFEGEDANQIATVTLPNELDVETDNLYVIDNGGNISQPISLVEDTQPPSAILTYPNGGIALNITDAVGIARVDDTTYSTYPTQTTYPVPAGVSQVTLVDALDNPTTFIIDNVSPQLSNIYVGDQGITMLIASDEAGIASVKYYVDDEEPQVIEFAGLPTTTPIEIPANIDRIGVLDAYGNESPLDFASVEIPTIQNIYKKSANVYSIETSGITEIYYKNPDKQVLVANPQAINAVTIPAGVTTIYVTDTNQNEVAIDISGVDTTVGTAAISGDGDKISINVDSTKELSQIVFYDANNQPIGTPEAVTGNAVNTVIEGVPEGTAYVKVVYEGGTSTKVVLVEDTAEPKASNTVMLEDGKKLVTLEDVSGISRIEYGDSQVLEIEGNPTKVVQELDLEGVEEITVYDMFDIPKVVNISEEAMNTVISDMATNMAGSGMFLSLSSQKGIDKLEYVDDQGASHVITNQATNEFRRAIDTVSADRIVVTYNDGTSTNFALRVEASAPTSDEIVKDNEGRNIKTNLYDDRGIKSITYGEQVITQGLEDYPKNVVLEIEIVDALGLSVGSKACVMANDGTTTITITSDEPDEDIIVTNVINNVETLSLSDATVDSTAPEVSVESEDDYFVLTATDEESGILRVVGKETGKVIFEPKGCPTTFTSPQTAYPQGDKNLIVYNGVVIPKQVLVKVDKKPPIIVWAYKNVERNYIYLVMTDESGIDRIEDQDGNVRVKFERD